jgi:hypothetical protein
MDPTDPDAILPGEVDAGTEDARQPTDVDLITDHPFRDLATRADLFPDICGHEVDGLPCGFSRAEHTDQGEET